MATRHVEQRCYENNICPCILLFVCKGRANDDVGVGGKGHRISGALGPGAGFKTGDFVEEKLGGAIMVERLRGYL